MPTTELNKTKRKSAPVDKEALHAECRAKIINQFFPTRGRPKADFIRCVFIVADFLKCDPKPSKVADLYFLVVEQGCLFAHQNYIGDEGYFDDLISWFEDALEYMIEKGLQDEYRTRMYRIMNSSYDMGFCTFDALCTACNDRNLHWEMDEMVALGPIVA